MLDNKVTRPKRTPPLREVESVVISTDSFRLAVSAFSMAAKCACEQMLREDPKSPQRSRAAVDHCIDGLAALAFAQIPKVDP